MNEDNKLLKRFLEFTADKHLASTGDKILLAVSGGLDSAVMSSLFSQSNFEFGIAHCNFQLRGEESDTDEQFVKELAIKSNKIFNVKRFDTASFAYENKISIQEAARELRYQWFNELCEEFKYDKIATAHHLNDSIETFFINLLRGTGPAGLRGIPVVNKNIIRPLLFARRSEIEEYAAELNLEYRSDSSNQSDDYTRNKIRHHLIPLLAEMSDNFEDTMRETFDDFTFINETMNSQIEEWKKTHSDIDESGNIILPLAEIHKSKYSQNLLSSLLYSYGIIGIDCKKILAVETPGKIFHSRQYLILRDREKLILQKKSEHSDQNFEINKLPATLKIGTLNVHISSKEKAADYPALGDKLIQHIDAEKVNLPLVMRTWQEGDYFFPLGMKGKKKISDFYTDQKLNRFEKDKTYLLLSGNDIVCILGHRIDERFKITNDTKKILSIELSEK